MADERLNPNWGNELKAATNAAGEVVGVLKPQSDSARAPIVVAATDAVTGAVSLRSSAIGYAMPESGTPLHSSRATPLVEKSPRITQGGYNWYSFTDHTSLTKSGAEAANYTLSTVSGVNGIVDAAPAYTGGSKTGSTALTKLEVSGQAGAVSTIFTSADNINIATGDGRLGFWVYISPDSTWKTPAINWDFYTATNVEVDFASNNQQCREGWNFIVFHTGTVSGHPYGITRNYGVGDFAVDVLRRFRFYIKVPAGLTLTAYFDTAWSNWRTTPAIAIGMDGSGLTDVTTYWIPKMSAYGYKGYISLSATATGDHTRLANYNVASGTTRTVLAAIKAAGWDVINHCLNHTNTSDASRASAVTEAQLQYQIKAQTAYQLAYGLDKGKEIFSSPQGRWDSMTNSQMQAMGIILNRAGSQGSNNTRTMFGYPNNMLMGWLSIDAPVSGAASANGLIAKMQAILDYGGDIIIGGHQIIADGGIRDGDSVTGNSLQIYATTFDLILSWISAKATAGECTVCTLTDMAYSQI